MISRRTVSREALRELTDIGRRNDIVASAISIIQNEVLCPFTIDVMKDGKLVQTSPDFQRNVLDAYYRPFLMEAIWHIEIYGFYAITFTQPTDPFATTTDRVPIVLDIESYDVVFDLTKQGQIAYSAEPRIESLDHIMLFVIHRPSPDGQPQSPTARALRHLRLIRQILGDIGDVSNATAHPPIVIQNTEKQKEAGQGYGDEDLYAAARDVAEYAVGGDEQGIINNGIARLRDLIDQRRDRADAIRTLHTLPPHEMPDSLLDHTYVWQLKQQRSISTTPTPAPFNSYVDFLHMLVAHVCTVFGISADALMQSRSQQKYAASLNLIRDRHRKLARDFHEILKVHLAAIYQSIYIPEFSRLADKNLANKFGVATTADEPHESAVAIPRFDSPPSVDMHELRQMALDGIISKRVYAAAAFRLTGIPAELVDEMPEVPEIFEKTTDALNMKAHLMKNGTDGGSDDSDAAPGMPPSKKKRRNHLSSDYAEPEETEADKPREKRAVAAAGQK